MQLELIDRAAQTRASGTNDHAEAISDVYFDGVEIPGSVAAHNWLREQSVHRTVLLSSEVDNTRNFLGPQVNMLRDDVRHRTWTAYVESGRLVLAEVVMGQINRRVLAEHDVWRSHLTLDKHTGTIIASWVTRGARRPGLWFHGKHVATKTRIPDFPFFALSQMPIGHVQRDEPSFGLLAYKCRDTGDLYLRTYRNGVLHDERLLKAPRVVGGVSFAISAETVVVRVDAVDGHQIRPMIAYSTDGGETFDEFKAIALPYSDGYRTMPAGPPCIDFGGHFHVPVGVTNGKDVAALDALLDKALVEAIRVEGVPSSGSVVALDAFPKRPLIPTALPRFGNGVTDGIGIIAVLVHGGRLFSSNSQAGGIRYPESVHLNHEMPTICALAHTQCYTAGVRPNHVSMDYAYLESGLENRPISRELHLETWDMPLPYPRVRATAEGETVRVFIEADANFEPGKTTFDFDDATITITRVEVADERNAIVMTDCANLKGKLLSFVVRSRFYHHEAAMTVE